MCFEQTSPALKYNYFIQSSGNQDYQDTCKWSENGQGNC